MTGLERLTNDALWTQHARLTTALVSLLASGSPVEVPAMLLDTTERELTARGLLAPQTPLTA